MDVLNTLGTAETIISDVNGRSVKNIAKSICCAETGSTSKDVCFDLFLSARTSDSVTGINSLSCVA